SHLVHGWRTSHANLSDQRLYRQDEDVDPRPITPEPPSPASIRYADIRATPDGRWLVCVRECHEPDGVANELAILPADGSAKPTMEPRTLRGGHDFFSNPRLSPDGTQLAWLSWDHPGMPWDGPGLSVAPFDPQNRGGEARVV